MKKILEVGEFVGMCAKCFSSGVTCKLNENTAQTVCQKCRDSEE